MKIDLHRHLGGSCSVELVHQLLLEQGEDISLDEVASRMQFMPGEEPGFHKFLRKFDILNRIKWTEDSIAKSVEQVVSDIKAEQIDLAEIRFTVDKYVDSIDRWDHGIAVEFLGKEFEKQAKERNIKINLILCMKYEADREKQRLVAAIIEEYGVEEFVHGIDLVGDEAFLDVDFYRPIFRQWKMNGKGLIAHVGESQTAENIRLAIEELQVDRIAHGIKVIDSPDTMKLAVDNGVCFEIALTSNLLTGVVSDIRKHPVKEMLDKGCIITIGTDDPVVCNTTLDKEYELLQTTFGLSKETIFEIKKNSFNCSL